MDMYSFINDRVAGESERRVLKPCVFLDRDGVVIRNMHYLKDPAQIFFLPGVFDGLRRMRQAGCRLILISNQSGVGRGYFSESDLLSVHRRMTELLAAEDLFLDACYYCPHRPEDKCSCRKPGTGMLQEACRMFATDRKKSWMIGDSECDMKLAKNFMIPGILIGEAAERTDFGQSASCATLPEAAEFIMEKYGSSKMG